MLTDDPKPSLDEDLARRSCQRPRLQWVSITPALTATQDARADCAQAARLIDGLPGEHLIADKGYDSQAIVKQARDQGMQARIPPRKNRKEQREYDRHLYRQRHLVENAFLHIKPWRGIATRYAKNLSSFLAAVQIRCFVL